MHEPADRNQQTGTTFASRLLRRAEDQQSSDALRKKSTTTGDEPVATTVRIERQSGILHFTTIFSIGEVRASPGWGRRRA